MEREDLQLRHLPKREASVWKAFNIPSLMMGIGTVLAGTASADIHGNLDVPLAILCLLFVIFAQFTVTSYHRYHDDHTPIGPDGKRIGQDFTGAADRALYYKVAATVAGMLAVMVGFGIITIGGWFFAVVGLVIAISAWLLVSGSHPVFWSPWCLVIAFLIFGPVGVMCVSLLQSGHETTHLLNWFDIIPAVFMSVTMGVLAVTCNLLINFSTYDFDSRRGHQTFPVLYGLRRTRALIFMDGIIGAGSLVWASLTLDTTNIIAPMVPALTLLVINTWIWWRLDKADDLELVRLERLAYFNMLLTGLIGICVGEFFGVPDDSYLRVF